MATTPCGKNLLSLSNGYELKYNFLYTSIWTSGTSIISIKLLRDQVPLVIYKAIIESRMVCKSVLSGNFMLAPPEGNSLTGEGHKVFYKTRYSCHI